MRRTKISGFTVIEIMLFLAITGLMVVGFLFGASRSINNQRYKDSVNTFKSIIQQQYSDVDNTINNHSNFWECSSTGVNELTIETGAPRGQSDCVLLGKLIRTVGTDGKKIKVNDVVGLIPAGPTTGLDDVTIFKKTNISPLPGGYGVYSSNVNEQEYDISWGASLSKLNGDSLSFSILIVRSPISGAVRTFYSETSETDDNIINIIGHKLDADKIICINSNDLFFGKPMAVKIVAGSSNASGVEALGESDSGCY